ncbi:zinc finger protein [Elysia marginata]|uniref:Zinc finger protein n=1 Tax=Elysia marginata TaxID=1093978 RepID=A0AAV4JXU7_9GAST|nr:zinc finger protein [Elysia marginata]
MKVCAKTLGTGVADVVTVITATSPQTRVELHAKSERVSPWSSVSQPSGDLLSVFAWESFTRYSSLSTPALPTAYRTSKHKTTPVAVEPGELSKYQALSSCGRAAALDTRKISSSGHGTCEQAQGRDVVRREEDGGGDAEQESFGVLTTSCGVGGPGGTSMTHSPHNKLGVSSTSGQSQHQQYHRQQQLQQQQQPHPCGHSVYLPSSAASSSYESSDPSKANRGWQHHSGAPPLPSSSTPSAQYVGPPGGDKTWGEEDSVFLKPSEIQGMPLSHHKKQGEPQQMCYDQPTIQTYHQDYSKNYVRAYVSHHGQTHAPSPPICQEFHGRPQPSLVVARSRHHSGDEGLLQGRRLQPQEQFLPFRASPPIFTQAAVFPVDNPQTCSEHFSQQYHKPTVSSGWNRSRADQGGVSYAKTMDTSEHHAQSKSAETPGPWKPSKQSSLAGDPSGTLDKGSEEAAQSSAGRHSIRSANVPEIQMTELLSEAEQAAPWMSHTPDNLSPTVQIVQKLSQATVSDSRGLDSPLTSSPASTSPRTHKALGLQVPTPERSPSFSPPSAHKQKQLFVFPEVGQQRQQPSPPVPLRSTGAGQLNPGSSLEAAGLSVSVASIKTEHLRWRHVSSGSSGDSSTTGDVSLAPPRPTTSGLATSKSTPVGLGASDRHDAGHRRHRHRFSSGDTDVDDTLIDSETGSSVAEEDSGSSREQSPFSGFPDTPGLTASSHSPGGSRRASPLGRRCSPSSRRPLHRQRVVGGYEEDVEGDQTGDGDRDEERLQPPKFKRRLHERYVSSLKGDRVMEQERSREDTGRADVSAHQQSTKMSTSSSPSRVIIQSSSDSGVDIKPTLKLESVSDDGDEESSSMPKSPRRSFTDESSYKTDSHDFSADEGDVFMEPAPRFPLLPHVPAQHHFQYPQGKPHIQQPHGPLDLSRGPLSPGMMMSMPISSSSLAFQQHGGHYRSLTSMPTDSDTPTSSPGGVKSAQASPSGQHYSPLYRHGHRLSYSPHGLVSPQSSSQSPLCSVPEGNRIFNFNMPSPYDPGAASSSGIGGGLSDSDIISPSPLSPRFFTFPSISPSHSQSASGVPLVGSVHDVNRLAVSPRGLYPTSPPLHSSMRTSSKAVAHVKWENFSKRSFSDSDVAYQCVVCGQAFPSNDNLAKHMAKHLPTETVRSGPDNSKVHYCKICDRSFSRSDMLTRHMRLHTGLKPYECVDCGQVFSRSDHLNTHKRTHTGEKPYRCPHCPYAACRRDMITRHMRTHSADKRASAHTHQGKRGRFLSMPEDDSSGFESGSKPSKGSGSSVETLEGNGGKGPPHSSLSSIESLDLELGHSQPIYQMESSDLRRGRRHSSRDFQASLESMASSSGQPRTSTSSRESEDPEDSASPSPWGPTSSSFRKGGSVLTGEQPHHRHHPGSGSSSVPGVVPPPPPPPGSQHESSSYFQDKQQQQPQQQQQKVRVPSPHPLSYMYPHGPPPLTPTSPGQQQQQHHQQYQQRSSHLHPPLQHQHHHHHHHHHQPRPYPSGSSSSTSSGSQSQSHHQLSNPGPHRDSDS